MDYVGGLGKSIVQFAAKIGVSKATVYNWKDQHPAFLDAFTRAQEASEAYWQNELVGMMREEGINSPLVKLYFANRFNWHDKKQIEEKSDESVAEALRDLADKLPD